MSAGMLIDLTRCVGCEACSWACKEANGLPRTDANGLSAATWTFVEHVKSTPTEPSSRDSTTHVKRQCMHCLEPACASVCPVGALRKSAAGPVTYDADRCIGCRYCMIACPFSVPKYEWSATVPRVQKCSMCHDALVARGRPTACASACPTRAISFGDRDALLREAHRRIREDGLRVPYVPRVYGETEAGGTSVLYLSNVSFEALGFKTEIRTASYPALTWRVLSKLPAVVSAAGVGLGSLAWIIRRRDRLAKERRLRGPDEVERRVP